ncbi:hypothetical protein [Enterococcus sp. AZ109]|uniref:hypothetical protein n=1 Tax=Enterococcus sp. AZ109 TaxID=2774634 RepID=UPI003F22178D
MKQAVDSALVLKMRNRKEELSEAEIRDLLNQSKVINGILLEKFRVDKFTGVRKLAFMLLKLSDDTER